MEGDMGKWTGSVEGTGLRENDDRIEHESGGEQRVYKTIGFPLLFVSPISESSKQFYSEYFRIILQRAN